MQSHFLCKNTRLDDLLYKKICCHEHRLQINAPFTFRSIKVCLHVLWHRASISLATTSNLAKISQIRWSVHNLLVISTVHVRMQRSNFCWFSLHNQTCNSSCFSSSKSICYCESVTNLCSSPPPLYRFFYGCACSPPSLPPAFLSPHMLVQWCTSRIAV